MTGTCRAAGLRFLSICLLICALALGGTASLAQPAGGAADAPAPTPTETLLEILRDDAARAALIAELEAARAAAAPVAAIDEEPVAVSIGRRLALATQQWAEQAAAAAARGWAALRAAPDAFDDVGSREFDVLIDALWDLLAVIALTAAIFVLLRRLFVPVFRRMGARARDNGVVRRALAYVGSGLLDLLVVVAAWAIGYAAMLVLFGEFGEIALRQTLYLNAFLAVETVKVGLRLVVSPATSDLRPLRISDAAAKRLYRVLQWTVSLIGYGQLLVVPIVNANASFAAGRSISALLALFAILYLGFAVIRYRAAVADWLMRQAATPAKPPGTRDAAAQDGAPGLGQDPVPGVLRPAAGADATRAPDPEPAPRARGAVATLARSWHWFALGWLAFMLIVVATRPVPVVFDVVGGSVRIALALIVGLVVSGWLGRAISRGIRLPQDVNARLPLLERRLDRFVPQMMIGLRLLIVAAVLIYALDTSGLSDFGALIGSEAGLRLSGTTASVVLILLVAFGLWLAMTSWVDYRLNPDFGSVATAREQTLLTLLRNAVTIALVIITLMFVLSEIGLDIGPLLASAGVLGLAIGFGAQKMVQDIITGIFIQFENAMNVGDVVTAGPTTGVVERLTIRSVSLRDINGVFHIIPFSSVDAVSNFMRDFSFHLCDMGVAYREDTEEAKQAMFDAFEELKGHPEQGAFILDDLEWFGLNSFGDSAVILRARIKTVPGKQWGVGRAYNEILKRVFDERGIEIPFPHQTIYFGESKDGKTQRLRISERIERPARATAGDPGEGGRTT